MIIRILIIILFLVPYCAIPSVAAPVEQSATTPTTDDLGCIHLDAKPYLGRTIEEITARWQQTKPAAGDNPYAAEPSWQAPYAAGALTPQYQIDAINQVNFMRYLAGLPDDVSINSDWLEEVQHGAVLLKKLNCLTHNPARPADMQDEFFKKGLRSCSSNNITFGYSKIGSKTFFQSAADSVTAYMHDLDTSEKAVGHRRWILNPPMKQTAFGWCESFSTMYAFDTSRKPSFEYASVSWPPPGQFPLQLCPNRLPWSVSLNHKLFDYTGQETVTMVRQKDNKTWVFSASSAPPDGLFMVDRKGYGIPYCIIFRPENSLVYAPGDTFKITIDGLKRAGKPASISYMTTLFDMPEMQPPKKT